MHRQVTCVPVVWNGAGDLSGTYFRCCFRLEQVNGDDTGLDSGNVKALTFIMSGFTNAGAGKLIGPDGQEMDTEEFLSSLEINSSG